MPRIKLFPLLGIALAFVSGAPLFAKPHPAVPAEVKEPNSWILIKPRQCLENAWEKDWISHHKKKTPYPIIEESDIIKNYFAHRGIAVSEIRKNPAMGQTCQTCDCDRGDTLYLL